MRSRAIIGVICAAVMLTACAPTSQEGATNPLVDETEAETLATAMLTAYTADDPAGFSFAFTDSLRSSMDETAFEQWRGPLFEATGDFVRITDNRVMTGSSAGSIRYVFHAAFSKDDSVQFAIVFKAGTHHINRVEMKPDK